MVLIRLAKAAGWWRDPPEPSLGAWRRITLKHGPWGHGRTRNPGVVLEVAGSQGGHGKANVVVPAVHALCVRCAKMFPCRPKSSQELYVLTLVQSLLFFSSTWLSEELTDVKQGSACQAGKSKQNPLITPSGRGPAEAE